METRIRRNIYIVVGVTFVVLVAMSAGWYAVLVRPQKDEIAKAITEYQALSAKASKLEVALENEQKAEDKLEYLQGQLNFFRGSKENERVQGLYRRLYFGEIDGTSPKNVADRQIAWRQWMNEYHTEFGPALLAELRRIRDISSVQFAMPAVKVDDPPQKPEDVAPPQNGFMKPLSATNNGDLTLTVTGTFDNILRFLENINHSSILMVVGNIKLEGYSPQLNATFTLTPYLIAAGPAIKLAASAPPAGAAPAGDGTPVPGAPGGVPGGPPSAGANAQAGGPIVKIKNPRLGA